MWFLAVETSKSHQHSWLHLRLDFRNNAVNIFNKGVEDGIYNKDNKKQQYVISPVNNSTLVQFLYF